VVSRKILPSVPIGVKDQYGIGRLFILSMVFNTVQMECIKEKEKRSGEYV